MPTAAMPSSWGGRGGGAGDSGRLRSAVGRRVLLSLQKPSGGGSGGVASCAPLIGTPTACRGHSHVSCPRWGTRLHAGGGVFKKMAKV